MNSDHFFHQNSYFLVLAIENITSYRFKDASLLERAFTDSSVEEKKTVNSTAFQRLEFYGDSVLNYLVSRELISKYPDMEVGELSILRAANVDKETLARVALKHHFHIFLRHRKPLFKQQIKEFKEAILEYPIHSNGVIDAPKALSDIVESFIGALHVDCSSWVTTSKVVKKLLQPMITRETLHMQPVTRLYELGSKHGWNIKFVDSKWKETGEIEVFIDGNFAGKGKYESKKLIALNRAAKDAYDQISTKLLGS